MRPSGFDFGVFWTGREGEAVAFGFPLAFHKGFHWGFIVCLITQITEQIIMVKHETVIVIVMASLTQQLL